MLSLACAGLVGKDEVQGTTRKRWMARTATPVVMEMSRRFMGRLSLHPGARVASSAPHPEGPAASQSRKQAGAAITRPLVLGP